MFVKVIGIVFLFLVRLRFPKGKSITNIIRNRYGNDIVRHTRNFEKIDYRLTKCEVDITFLESCQKNNFTPKFLQFRLSNKKLQTSSAYIACQQRLLKEEINQKKSRLRHLKTEIELVRVHLKARLNRIDFIHICCLFLVQNDRELNLVLEQQNKK